MYVCYTSYSVKSIHRIWSYERTKVYSPLKMLGFLEFCLYESYMNLPYHHLLWIVVVPKVKLMTVRSQDGWHMENKWLFEVLTFQAVFGLTESCYTHHHKASILDTFWTFHYYWMPSGSIRLQVIQWQMDITYWWCLHIVWGWGGDAIWPFPDWIHIL